MYIQISRFVVLIASMAITLGLYAQLFKLHRTKSADDFSAVLVTALLLNELAWLNYGCALREWPMILVGSANMPAVVGIVIGYWRYHHEDRG